MASVSIQKLSRIFLCVDSYKVHFFINSNIVNLMRRMILYKVESINTFSGVFFVKILLNIYLYRMVYHLKVLIIRITGITTSVLLH